MSVFTDVLPLPDTGLPLPENHPEFAACDWCRHKDRASLMYHAGNGILFCLDMAMCNVRWEDNRRQQPVPAGDDPYAVPGESAAEAEQNESAGCEQ